MSNLALFDLEEPEPTEGRDPLDRYYTPEWATQALVDYLGYRLTGSVWDPCCGKDWGGRVIRKSPHVEGYLGTDIDPDAVGGGWSSLAWPNKTRESEGGLIPSKDPEPFGDFLKSFNRDPKVWIGAIGGHDKDGCTDGFGSPDWIVTNPPYKTGSHTATDFVRHALNLGLSVAMLLRLTWLEPCADRVDILTEDPPTDVLILPRVNFIGAPGSNPCTSAWLVWDRFKGRPTRTAWHRRSA